MDTSGFDSEEIKRRYIKADRKDHSPILSGETSLCARCWTYMKGKKKEEHPGLHPSQYEPNPFIEEAPSGWSVESEGGPWYGYTKFQPSQGKKCSLADLPHEGSTDAVVTANWEVPDLRAVDLSEYQDRRGGGKPKIVFKPGNKIIEHPSQLRRHSGGGSDPRGEWQMINPYGVEEFTWTLGEKPEDLIKGMEELFSDVEWEGWDRGISNDTCTVAVDKKHDFPEHLDSQCGAYVCRKCNSHMKHSKDGYLGSCFCGWDLGASKMSGDQIRDMGEDQFRDIGRQRLQGKGEEVDQRCVVCKELFDPRRTDDRLDLDGKCSQCRMSP